MIVASYGPYLALSGRDHETRSVAGRLDADDDGVGGAVVQAAQVAVGQQWRYHGEQDRGPDQRPAEADQSAADTDRADADQPFAHGAPAQRGQDVDLDREDRDRPELRS